MPNDELTALEKIHGPLPQLQPADIVLVRIRGSLLRAMVRYVTDSYWDHSTMIIYPQGEHGVQSNIIIENIQRGVLVPSLRKGTEIHKLDKYLRNPRTYDVGIKRVPWLGRTQQRHIRAFMMTNIDTPYWKLPFSQFLLATVSAWYRRRLLRRQRWSCSGLVQRAYYESATAWKERLKLVFKEGDWSPIEMQDLTSPADIARSDKALWVYNPH